jgi:hypothetical protein
MQNLDYDPNRASVRRNAIIFSVFSVLLVGAFWYSLTSTLDQMTRRDCDAGIERACKSLQN